VRTRKLFHFLWFSCPSFPFEWEWAPTFHFLSLPILPLGLAVGDLYRRSYDRSKWKNRAKGSGMWVRSHAFITFSLHNSTSKRNRRWIERKVIKNEIGVGFESNSTLHPLLRVYLVSTLQTPIKTRGSVCKVRTQDPENLDEEVKSLVTAWRYTCSHIETDYWCCWRKFQWANCITARHTKDLTIGAHKVPFERSRCGIPHRLHHFVLEFDYVEPKGSCEHAWKAT